MTAVLRHVANYVSSSDLLRTHSLTPRSFNICSITRSTANHSNPSDKHITSPFLEREMAGNTDRGTPAASVHAVFNTTELLELILLRLPLVAIRDMLCVQRVNRSFRSTIQGSNKLKKRLFLIPDSAVPVEEDEDDEEYLWAFNPLLAPPCDQGGTTYFKCGDVYIGLSRMPFHLLHVDQYAFRLHEAEEHDIPGIQSEGRGVKRKIEAGDKVARSGSWEAMYVTQPTQNVHVSLVTTSWQELGFQTETPTTSK